MMAVQEGGGAGSGSSGHGGSTLVRGLSSLARSPSNTGSLRDGDSGRAGTLSTSSSSATLQLLLEPSLRRPLIVCVTLMAAQQLSGINNAFNYSSR